MGAMTGQTLALSDRLVLDPLAKGLFLLGMAGVTQIPSLLLEEALKFCDMGIMTLSALALDHRLMDNLADELLLGMALDAFRHDQGRGRRSHQQGGGGKQYGKRYLHQFPSP